MVTNNVIAVKFMTLININIILNCNNENNMLLVYKINNLSLPGGSWSRQGAAPSTPKGQRLYSKNSITTQDDYCNDFTNGNKEKINKNIEGDPQINSELNKLNVDNSTQKSPILPRTFVKVYPDANLLKSEILKDYKDKSIIYMWFNKTTGKVYIGSAVNGSKRLSAYYQPSVLKRKSLIYQNILKYGHANFYIIILEICGNTSTTTKNNILAREKFYIDWALKTYGLAVLNVLVLPGSSLGYKHRKETLLKMSLLKKGDKNPMFQKPKSKAFLALQAKGGNNPRFGVAISEKELKRRMKKIYLYNSSKELIKCYDNIGLSVKDLHIAAKTIRKYRDSDKLYKNMYFFYSKLQ